MPGKTRYPVFILYLIIFILLQDKPAIAQQQPFLDKKVSFTFTDIPLANCLHAIGNRSGVKFSYNPELIPPGRRINMRFNNIPLKEVLKLLLNDPAISFKEIGNQIVLYRGDPQQFPLEPNQQLIKGKPQLMLPAKKIPDTVYVYQLDTLIIKLTDTLFRSISITHFDTIRTMDTVFVEKGKSCLNAASIIHPGNAADSVKYRRFLENNGFYTGLYFATLPGQATFKSRSAESASYLEMVKNANSGQSTKISAGIVAGYDYHWMGIRAGLGYSVLGEKFAYSFNVETGGLFRTDTIETFFTLSGNDTSWFYITDSTWIPKDDKRFTYKNSNSYRYIDIPFLVKLRFWHTKSAEIYALGGVSAAFLVSVDALQIDPDNMKNVIWTKESDLSPVLFSWHAGIGTSVKFTSRTGILAEATYSEQTNNQFKNSPINKRYSLIGIKMAAYFKF